MAIKQLIPYSSDIDEKTAMQEALKIWAWLKDTGEGKLGHPEWHIVQKYNFKCPLCSAFRHDDECNKCPLVQNDIPCYENYNLYEKWEREFSKDVSSKYRLSEAATAIYDKIFFEYKRRYNEEFNPYE